MAGKGGRTLDELGTLGKENRPAHATLNKAPEVETSRPAHATHADDARNLNRAEIVTNTNHLDYIEPSTTHPNHLNDITQQSITQTTAKQTFNLDDIKPHITINKDGLQEVNIKYTPLGSHNKLNQPDIAGNGKLRPAEAAMGAQLESVLGEMQRANVTESYDFITSNGKK